jgi:deoxyhypusine synthase
MISGRYLQWKLTGGKSNQVFNNTVIPMNSNRELLKQLYDNLQPPEREMVNRAVDQIVDAKKKQGNVVVVTGSGPNIHEGVTTLIAELINKGVVDGVTTSSAVVAHEMAGVLDEVKRVDGKKLGFTGEMLPLGDVFEITRMSDELLDQLKKEMTIDTGLIEKALSLEGDDIIKAAGNMAYPMGLRTENLAKEILFFAKSKGLPFEVIAGAGADERTMLGAARKNNVPCLVTVPQLIGGGTVGLALADSISIMERSSKIAEMMSKADVIIESAVALTQEIHDGPFETFTGHGIWSNWEGSPTYSLERKTLIRIDLDPILKKAWDFEKGSGAVQEAIDKGMPKTKFMNIPFRMEMSGFTRLEKSIPIVGDIGFIWPIMAYLFEQELGIELDFMSYPQQSKEGQEMRKWIVKNILPVNREKICKEHTIKSS